MSVGSPASCALAHAATDNAGIAKPCPLCHNVKNDKSKPSVIRHLPV